MAFLKSRRGAVVVTVLVILFSVVFGAHRSLTSLRSDALEVFETGAYGDGHSVKGDLEARRATCANLYTVASRYLPADNANLTDLKSNLDALSADVTDPFAQADLAVVAELVLNTLADEALSIVADGGGGNGKSCRERRGAFRGRSRRRHRAQGNFLSALLPRKFRPPRILKF